LTGSFAATAQFGGPTMTATGVRDMFVSKLSSDGIHLWSKRFGGNRFVIPSAIAVDGDGRFTVVGWFEQSVAFGADLLLSSGGQDGFIAHFDADGSPQWAHALGGLEQDRATAVAVDASGDIIVTGIFTGSMNELVSTGSHAGFARKYSRDGGRIWTRQLGGAHAVEINDVAIDATGDIVLGGSFTGTLGPHTSSGSWDVYFAKLDMNGDVIWSKAFGGAGIDSATGIAIAHNHDIVLVGRFIGSASFGGSTLISNSPNDGTVFIAKYTPDGSHQWSRTIAGSASSYASDAAVDGSGNIVIAGGFSGFGASLNFGVVVMTSRGPMDAFAAKYQPDGTIVWAVRIGGEGFETATGVAVAPDGHVLVAGHFDTQLDLTIPHISSAGGDDVFVVRRHP
jgi:hypothetical protein